VDALLLAVLNQVIALQDRVTLDLVGSGHNTGTVDESLEMGDGVVGDTDGAGLALGKLGHGYIDKAQSLVGRVLYQGLK
jgi:hypothetical protein